MSFRNLMMFENEALFNYVRVRLCCNNILRYKQSRRGCLYIGEISRRGMSAPRGGQFLWGDIIANVQAV